MLPITVRKDNTMERRLFIKINGIAIAAAVACFAEAGFSLIEWEAEWAKSEGAIFAGIAVAAVVAVVAGFWAYRSAQLKAA